MTFGVIGTNFISDWFMAALPFANSAASAVYSRKKETGDAFASRHGIPLVFDDLDAFLSSDAFDAVYIASPNFLHESQAVRALRAGKHVLVEKPASPSLSGYLRACDEAKKQGRVYMEAMRPVHDGLLKKVKENLYRIGKVRSAHLEFCQYSSRYDRHKRGEYTNTFDPALSNAAILDIGIYPIETAVWLFGTPKEVCGKSLILENGFEGAGEAVLAYGDHNVAISYSKVADSLLPSVILGEAGGVTVDKLVLPTRAVFRFRSGEELVLTREETKAATNMHDEILDFVRAIDACALLPEHKTTADALAVCDALRKGAGVVFPSDNEDTGV